MPKKIDMRAFLIDKEEHIEQAARAMKAMSHPLRLKILCVLGNQEVSVQGIVDSVGTSQSNISQHLAILRGACCARARPPTGVYYPSRRHAYADAAGYDARGVLRHYRLTRAFPSQSLAAFVSPAALLESAALA